MASVNVKSILRKKSLSASYVPDKEGAEIYGGWPSSCTDELHIKGQDLNAISEQINLASGENVVSLTLKPTSLFSNHVKSSKINASCFQSLELMNNYLNAETNSDDVNGDSKSDGDDDESDVDDESEVDDESDVDDKSEVDDSNSINDESMETDINADAIDNESDEDQDLNETDNESKEAEIDSDDSESEEDSDAEAYSNKDLEEIGAISDVDSGADDSIDNNDDAEESDELEDGDDSEEDFDKMDKQMMEKYGSEEDDSEADSDVGKGESDELFKNAEDEESDEDSDGEPLFGNDDDESEEDEETDEDCDDKKDDSHIKIPKFGKSLVDSEFFNVRESEWIADNDMIGDATNLGIDLFEDIDDENDGEINYQDFFDVPDDGKKLDKKQSKHDKKRLSKPEANVSDEGFVDTNNSQKDEDDVFNDDHTKQMSTYEKTLNKETNLQRKREAENLAEKKWSMKGETVAKDRPEHSVNEEALEYKSGQRSKPIIDQNMEERILKLILNRFRTKIFDDVERQRAPIANYFNYKQELVLNQEKSEKSLSQIYEDERIKDEQKKSGELTANQKGIIKKYLELDTRFNCLSNSHYTPAADNVDLKIMTSKPAVELEEITPIVMAEGSTLTTKEVMLPEKGILKGDDERTMTDKKRDRRLKKYKQGMKAKHEEEKDGKKIAKATKSGKKLDSDTSARIVQKAVKAGHVKMMDDSGVKVGSSATFFKLLQEKQEASAQGRKRKREAEALKANKK